MESTQRGRSKERVVPVRGRRSVSLPPAHHSSYDLPIQTNWNEPEQVLGYSHSLEKVSQVFGLDIDRIKEIQMYAEQDMMRERLLANSRQKRVSQKALEVLGHDPSTEKVKKTLGMDESDLEEVRKENIQQEEHRLSKKRSMTLPYNKKQSAKALSTLGFDPSAYRTMKLLGLEERSLKKALTEESIKLEMRIAQARKHVRNRKDSRKALMVVGYDPSKEKAIQQLGAEASEVEWFFTPR